jgi:hypothetical protein
MNVLVKCDAILRADGKKFQRLLWTRKIQEQHNCNTCVARYTAMWTAAGAKRYGWSSASCQIK